MQVLLAKVIQLAQILQLEQEEMVYLYQSQEHLLYMQEAEVVAEDMVLLFQDLLQPQLQVKLEAPADRE